MTISKAAQELGRKGGQAKSQAKTAAARANAKKPRTSAWEWKQQRNELLAALKLILPMAKGYAAMHHVGNNDAYCSQAECAIHRAESLET